MSRDLSLNETAALAVSEQIRAVHLRDSGALLYVADDDGCPDVMRLAALAEELGEVARCLHDGDRDSLKAELVQLAGVAIAWGSVA